MTVIAWDGATLAADKRATNSGTTTTVTKIHRVGDVLVGASGDLPAAQAMLDWFTNGADPARFPAIDRKEEWALLLVISPDGRIRRYEARPFPFWAEPGPCAIGTGRDFALMAMHLGHDARRAVELTSELSVDCGNGIDTLTFGKP